MAEAPILVLAIGNILLSDDGVGVRLLEELRGQGEFPPSEVEFVDGGTQGLALLGYLAGRRAVVILDALRLGAPPGKVRRLTCRQVLASGARAAAHPGNAGELLRTAALLDELPPGVTVIGVEAARVETGVGLSGPVRRALPKALRAATAAIKACLTRSAPGPAAACPVPVAR